MPHLSVYSSKILMVSGSILLLLLFCTTHAAILSLVNRSIRTSITTLQVLSMKMSNNVPQGPTPARYYLRLPPIQKILLPLSHTRQSFSPTVLSLIICFSWHNLTNTLLSHYSDLPKLNPCCSLVKRLWFSICSIIFSFWIHSIIFPVMFGSIIDQFKLFFPFL